MYVCSDKDGETHSGAACACVRACVCVCVCVCVCMRGMRDGVKPGRCDMQAHASQRVHLDHRRMHGLDFVAVARAPFIAMVMVMVVVMAMLMVMVMVMVMAMLIMMSMVIGGNDDSASIKR